MLINILFFLCALTLCLSANIERPCKPNDYKCLQKYLKANSKCNPKVLGKIPKNYTIYKKNIFKFETPFANASGIDHNINVKNHNKCHFTEFFINRDTNKAVLAMDCPFFTQDIDRKLIQHATYKEDVVFSYHIKYIHPLVRFTMNIPNARNINICQATVFVDVAALPIVHVNPKDAASKKYFKSHNLANIIYEREQFADRGWQIMTKTISALLCNFGCVIQDS